MAQPPYGQPGIGQPGYGQPGYGPSGYSHPGHAEAAPGQYGYDQPAYGGYGGDLQTYGRGNQPPADPLPYNGPPLPPPIVYGPPTAPTITRPPQRPAVIGMATTMAVTASLLFVCGLSFAWLTAVVGTESLGTSGVDGGVYHMLHRFHLRMINGLAWPLYLFPAAALVIAFAVLARNQWGRILFTATGLAALGWSAWWLNSDLRWWLPIVVYVGICCLLVWTPAASRWYTWRPDPPVPITAAGQQTGRSGP